MELEKLLAGIERFFYDIVGSLIPAAILIVGCWWIFDRPVALPNTTPGWLFFVAVAFVIGSALTTLAEGTLVWLVVRVNGLFREPKSKTVLRDFEQVRQEVASKDGFVLLAQRFFPGQTISASSFSELRNIAMSLIPADDRATVIRFMFLSLMSLGSAAAALILTLVAVAVYWGSASWLSLLLLTVLGLTVTWILMIRRFEFFQRSQRLPFDMAVAQIRLDSWNMQTVERETSGAFGSTIRSVYLAGGHRNPWRDTVINSVPVLKYRDPSTHSLRGSREYTAWDLEAIRRSDVVFAYFEGSNPSGFGLSLEVGYAAALRKHVIFVDEKTGADQEVGRYLRIVHETSTVSFTSLGDGIAYLKRLADQLAPEAQKRY